MRQVSSNREPIKLIRTLSGHTDPVNACAISSDGSFMVSAAGNRMKIYGHKNDNTLKVWDFETGAERFTLFGHNEAVTDCAVSQDSNLIISLAEDCVIVWDAITGKLINRFQAPGIACSACTGDFSIVIASFFIVLLDFQSGEERISILADDLIHDCAISADGSFIVTAGTDQHLVVCNAKDGETLAVLKPRENVNPYGDVSACSISPDSSFIISGGDDGILRIWDTDSFQEIKVLKGHNKWITGCDVSRDNSRIVSSSEDGTIKVWAVESGEVLSSIKAHTGAANDCKFSPCGNYIVTAGDDMCLRVWGF